MGKLSAPPRPVAYQAPATQIIYIPTVQTPSAAETKAAQEQAEKDQAAKAEEAVAQERQNNLLRRDRGRTGTIQTSFRGLLEESTPQGQQKTLLGD